MRIAVTTVRMWAVTITFEGPLYVGEQESWRRSASVVAWRLKATGLAGATEANRNGQPTVWESPHVTVNYT